MKRLFHLAIFAGILAFASSAHAQFFLERSGRIFHTRVCDSGRGVAGIAYCHAHVVTDSGGRPFRVLVSQGGQVLPNAKPAVAAGPYTPAQLRAAYGITGLGSASTTVAVVDAYGYPNAASDLAVYRTQYGLGACTTASGCLKIVNQNGSTTVLPRSNAGWDEEQALDLDMVSAMCPHCHILLVQASSANYNDLATAENTAVRLGARAIGNSYGGGEAGTTTYANAYNHAGVAITASAGDSGYGVSFPASSPYVIAVGGTSLVWNGASRTETVWSGTGSGCSKTYGEPTWQISSKAGMANNTLCTKRMLNDVSVVADPNTGVIVYMNIPPYAAGYYVFGGTSASAQIIAGIYGERGNTVSYASSLYSGYTSLFDVTSGSNGSCGSTYFCTGFTGYDGPTGLGTPRGDSPF